MTTIQRPNKDALIKVIDIYRDAMRPFLIHHLRQVPGGRVEDAIKQALRDNQANQFDLNIRNGRTVEESIDVNDFPELVQTHWRDLFSKWFTGDRTIRNRLFEIKTIRDEASHPGASDLDEEKTRAHIYMVADVLSKIGRTEEKTEVEKIRDDLFIRPLAEATVHTEQPQSTQGIFEEISAPRASELRPWREVIRPNEDVTEGRFRQAEFAASLQRVYDGRARDNEYGNPVSFFNRTFITPGMRALLVNTIQRLNGSGGDPVIQTKTGFGGGKTHSLIALYHLVRHADILIDPPSGSDSSTSTEINNILKEAGFNEHPSGLGTIAVLDGTHLSPTDQKKTEDGYPLNTLWGEMAYQLGGQQGYEIVGEAARTGIAPGQAQLDVLLEHVGPCVILIDELVAYWRNDIDSERVYTFLQALTHSVSASKDATLVVTLPENQEEAGGERGIQALETLGRLFARIEAIWEPLAVNQAFEVVSRRLFGEILNPAERDQTCEAFSRMYSGNRRSYPQGCGEQAYLDRMKACYPIHPEIFERLYSDWSTLTQFQRTRGVLRMMASCVSYLYRQNDASPLIMPANLPIRDPAMASEFERLLPGNWGPVISEADSDGGRADRIDETERFARAGGAAKRTARAIFLGSAPGGALRGIDERQIRLGTAQPGDRVASYNEAMQEMSKELHYLYSSNDRYYFHAEENLNKVATDRAIQFLDTEVDRHIVDLLNNDVRRNNRDVIVFANSEAVIPDNGQGVRLVILPPDKAINSRSSETNDAETEARRALMTTSNDGNRIHRNTVLFLAAKRDEARTLRQAVRNFLAWQSITQVRNGDDRRITGLIGERANQATAGLGNAASTVRSALLSTYRWGLAPSQPDPQDATKILFNEFRTNVSDQGEIANAALNRFIEEEALVEKISPASLARILQQRVWGTPTYGDHIDVNALWGMLTSYVYLPRLRNRSVLQLCIEEGVVSGTFGYARGYNSETCEYRELRYEGPLHDPALGMVINENSGGLLVAPGRAAEEKLKELQSQDPDEPKEPGQGTYTVKPTPGGAKGPDDPPTPDPIPSRPRRVRASKTVQGDLSLDDFSNLRNEIIRVLRDGGGDITVTITIEAQKSDGFEEGVTRPVRDNSGQLGLDFDSFDPA